MKKDLISWGTFYPPMRAFKRLFSNMEDLFEHCPGFPSSGQLPLGVNLSEDERNYEVSAELPGVPKEAIKVEITDNILIIRAHKSENKKTEGKQYHKTEYSYGEFYREIPLTKSIEADNVQANFKDGILNITIPKKSSNSKNIQINEGKDSQENRYNYNRPSDNYNYSAHSHSSPSYGSKSDEKQYEKTNEFTLKHKSEEPYSYKGANEDSNAKPKESTHEFSLKYKSEDPNDNHNYKSDYGTNTEDKYKDEHTGLSSQTTDSNKKDDSYHKLGGLGTSKDYQTGEDKNQN